MPSRNDEQSGSAEVSTPGEARRLASSALLQQLAQGSGLVALFVIITVLARRLSLVELGAYGLLAPLAGYLLVLRHMVAGSAVRAMSIAPDDTARGRAFSAAAVLYAAAAAGTGLLIAIVGLALGEAVLEGELEEQAQLGGLVLGGVTAVGIAISVHLDALRASGLLARSAVIEIVGVALFLALMLSLILSDASLWLVIGANGAIPLFSGTLSALAVRRLGLPYRFHASEVTQARVAALLPTAGYLLVTEASTILIYALARPIVGLFKSAATVGLLEGPVRAHNLFYAYYGALGVITLPTVSRYAADGDRRRLRELALRGSRYTLAVVVPVCTTLICLSDLVLDAWLGPGFGDGGATLSILISYWLLFGSLGVNYNLLVGAGRARDVARYMAGVAAGSIGLSLALTPILGLEGPAVAVAVSYVAAFPYVQRLALSVSGVRLAELARTAWLPAYGLGAALAASLIALRNLVPLDSLPATVGVLLCAPLLAWVAYYLACLDPSERELIRDVGRGLLNRSG